MAMTSNRILLLEAKMLFKMASLKAIFFLAILSSVYNDSYSDIATYNKFFFVEWPIQFKFNMNIDKIFVKL